MNPQEQNIAIAEWMGWTRSVMGVTEYWTNPSGKCALREDYVAFTIPNYHSDLNAIHEAEARLTPEQCNKYELLLGVFNLAIDPVEKRFFFKSAPQRCKALLRTIGKWKD